MLAGRSVVTINAMFCAWMLAGCAAPISHPAGGSSDQITAPYGEPAFLTNCELIPAHVERNGTAVDAAYSCPPSVSAATLKSYGCSWVAGYYSSDGRWVGSHTRCPRSRNASTSAGSPTASSDPAASATSTTYAAPPASSTLTTGASDAPCVTGYCGSTNVRGHYRKDGTYVRPHTRSRSRR